MPARRVDQRDTQLNESLLHLLEDAGVGHAVQYRKGQMLYWQGDPVEHILVVRRGAVKVFSISEEGRVYTYGILGIGGLAGASEYLLGRHHDTLAQSLERTDVIAMRPDEFERMLTSGPRFSTMVMRKLAEGVTMLAGKVRSLGFLDVQERLKDSLMELAEQHGIVTGQGIRIGLDITHEEIGTLVAANRSTITSCLSEFKRQGYVWEEGRHLIVIPRKHLQVLEGLNRAVLDGNEKEVARWADQATALGVDPIKAFEALADAMRRVDRMLVHSEIDVSDVILSAYVMKRGLAALEEDLGRSGGRPGQLGTVVIGTVCGDIHDIGQTIVAMLLSARGFRVIDLGVSVETARFVDAVRGFEPDILAMSSLMTTSAPEQRAVIRALEAAGLRDRVLVVVGGGAITQQFSREIGADGYAPTAQEAVELAWQLVSQRLSDSPAGSTVD